MTNPLFVWEMGFNQENKLTAVLQIPTGVLIAPGIELTIAKAAARKIAFDSCEPSRCVATFPVDEKIVKEIAANPKVDIVVKSVTGQTVTFQIDAAGIDRASLGLLNR